MHWVFLFVQSIILCCLCCSSFSCSVLFLFRDMHRTTMTSIHMVHVSSCSVFGSCVQFGVLTSLVVKSQVSVLWLGPCNSTDIRWMIGLQNMFAEQYMVCVCEQVIVPPVSHKHAHLKHYSAGPPPTPHACPRLPASAFAQNRCPAVRAEQNTKH